MFHCCHWTPNTPQDGTLLLTDLLVSDVFIISTWKTPHLALFLSGLNSDCCYVIGRWLYYDYTTTCKKYLIWTFHVNILQQYWTTTIQIRRIQIKISLFLSKFVPGIPAFGIRAPIPNIYPVPAINAVSMARTILC